MSPDPAEASACDTIEGTSIGREEWRKHCANLRHEMGVSSEFRPWSSKPGIKMQSMPQNERFREVVELAWIDRLIRTRAAGITDEKTQRAGYFVDYSQSGHRKPWGAAKTLTQGRPSCRVPFGLVRVCRLIQFPALVKLFFFTVDHSRSISHIFRSVVWPITLTAEVQTN